MVPVAERCLQETPLPDHLCGHPGRDFAPNAQIQVSTEGLLGHEGKGERSTAANDLGKNVGKGKKYWLL